MADTPNKEEVMIILVWALIFMYTAEALSMRTSVAILVTAALWCMHDDFKLMEKAAEAKGMPAEAAADDSASSSVEPSCAGAVAPAVIALGLTPDIVERQSRQMLLRDIGASGQVKISEARVLVVGAGGLGCAVIPYLAGAGVGALGIVDPDIVERSNLHRQVIHLHAAAGGSGVGNSKPLNSSAGVVQGENKAESAARFVRGLHPGVQVVAFKEVFGADNALRLVRAYDVVVDATDNPRSRYLLSDACVLAKKPLVSGSAVGLEGQLTVYNYGGGPCYRCIYPKLPGSSTDSSSSGGSSKKDNNYKNNQKQVNGSTARATALSSSATPACSDSGVLGPVPGVIGILQATETLKLLVGFGEVLVNKLAMYDARACSFRTFKLPGKRPSCSACGDASDDLDLRLNSMADSETFCEALALRGYGGCGVLTTTTATTANTTATAAGTVPEGAEIASGVMKTYSDAAGNGSDCSSNRNGSSVLSVSVREYHELCCRESTNNGSDAAVSLQQQIQQQQRDSGILGGGGGGSENEIGTQLRQKKELQIERRSSRNVAAAGASVALKNEEDEEEEEESTGTKPTAKHEPKRKHVLLDVRDANQFLMCHLKGAVNVPLVMLEEALQRRRGAWPEELLAACSRHASNPTQHHDHQQKPFGGDDVERIYVVCRRGIASQAAVRLLVDGRRHVMHQQRRRRKEEEEEDEEESNRAIAVAAAATLATADIDVIHIRGGLVRWGAEVDPGFPSY